MSDSKALESLRRLGIEPLEARRVLVVDDEFENLVVIEALLEDDYEVLTAESGLEALEILETVGDVDLIISDQRMPGMTGVQLLSRVAATSPSTVRIVVTAYSDVAPIVDAVNAGSVYRFLLKPWDARALRAAVEDGLEAKARGDVLRAAVEALSERSASLHATLADRQRTQDQLLAAERLSTLGRLTSGITHDISNQLNAMMSLLFAVQEETTAPDVLDAAETAYQTVQSLAYLVRDVNTFARRETVTVERAAVELTDFLIETIRLFQFEEVSDGLEVILEGAHHGLRAHVDAHHLQQALLAVLRNAALASERGATIRVQVQRNGSRLRLDVVDEGVGMTSDVLARARDPFFSGFDPPGLGLGLGIVELVIDAHGGSLDLSSEVGCGTRVSLCLGEMALAVEGGA